ncbi:MAG: PQQ-dependent sugar dehydrogenase, partial [Chitinophagaceae bacterium]
MFRTSLSLMAYAVFLISCGTSTSTNGSAGPNGNADTTGMPVESQKANTNYPPAFAGQTRIKGVKTSTGWTSKVVTSSLNKP